MTPAKPTPADAELPVAGWREWAALPGLGIRSIRPKLDTGARTSALVARDIEDFERNGHRWVRFTVYPRQRTKRGAVRCEAPCLEERDVRSSMGHVRRRRVIRTEIVLGTMRWPIEVTLAKRTNLRFRMLLGREAMRGRLLVDSARGSVFGRPKRKGTEPTP
ncbi:MAG: RimK/LysX family protein [Planctomycetota bacterium]|nr:RimK/LysX family protein [Planctomycetota bacterium]